MRGDPLLSTSTELGVEHGRNGLALAHAHFTLEREAGALGNVYEALRFGTAPAILVSRGGFREPAAG